MKDMQKYLIMTLAALIAFCGLSLGGDSKVQAASQVVTFPESTQRSQQKTITIPGIKKVDSVTVNTGTVTYSLNGENLTINVDFGDFTRYTGSYTPPSTRPDSLGDCRTSASGPPDYVYSIYRSFDDGYSGYIYLTGITQPYPTTQPTYYCGNYSGTLTKPGYDSRVYYYVYNVTVNYTDNTAPDTLVITKPALMVTMGYGSLIMEGTATDPDNDNLTVSASIGGVSKSATVQSGNWQLKWSADTIPEGTYNNIVVTVDDGKGGTKTVTHTKSVIIDRTPPAQPIFTQSPTEATSGNVSVSIKFPSDAMAKNYRWSGQITWTPYTEPISVTKNGMIETQAIDLSGNTTLATYTVSNLVPPTPQPTIQNLSATSVRIEDQRDYGSSLIQWQFSLLKKGTQVTEAESPWQDTKSFDFTGLLPNTVYDVKVETRFK